MAKKKEVSRITPDSTPSVNMAAFQTSSDLPTTQQAVETVEVLTGQISNTIEKMKIADRAIEPKSYGRPKKEKAVGREPFTTSLHSDFAMMLKERAMKRKCTVADLLDTILSEHLHNY